MDNKDNQLVIDIAKHMTGWKAVDMCEWSGVLEHTDGAKITIRTSGGRVKGKGSAYPSWPRSVDNSCMSGHDWNRESTCISEMNFSLDKSPEMIAKDIQRRLVAQFLTEHKAASEELAKRKAHQDARRAVITKLATMFNEKPSEHRREGMEFTHYVNDGVYLTVSVDYDLNVDIKASDIKQDVAIKILKLLGGK